MITDKLGLLLKEEGNGLKIYLSIRTIILPVVLFALLCLMGSDANQEASAQNNTGPKPELVIQNAHSVNSIAFSPDGKLMASAGIYNTVKLWDVSTGRLIKNFEGHTAGVFCVSFSPDSSVLASSSMDNTVKLWDTKTGLLIRTLKKDSGQVSTMGIRSISFNHDGTVLAAAYQEEITLWDVNTGYSIQTIGENFFPFSVAFSPDGTVLAGGSVLGVINLWNVKNGKILEVLKGHSGMVWSVAFSPDGKILASGGGSDKTARLWKVKNGKLLKTLKGHYDDGPIKFGDFGVICVSFSPGEDRILVTAGGGDKTVKVWDANSGKIIRTIEGHKGNVMAAVFSPDGRVLASGGFDNTIKLWEVNTGRLLRTLNMRSQAVNSVFFHEGGRLMAIGNGGFTFSGANNTKLWDVSRGKPIRSFKEESDWVKSVSLSPDGKILASGGCKQAIMGLCSKGFIKLWDAATGKLIKNLKGDFADMSSVAFSPDGEVLASGGCEQNGGQIPMCAKGQLKLWDANTGRLIKTFKWDFVKAVLKNPNVSSVSFSPDGKILASAGWDQTIRLWDVGTGRLIKTLEGHTGNMAWLNAVTFSPDGKLLASGSMDKTIKIWDVATGKAIHTLSADMGETRFQTGVASISFSRDGRVLASGNSDNIIRLWDVNSGQLIRTFKGHSGAVTSIVFSSDGKVLVSGSTKTMKYWEVNTGKLLCTLVLLDKDDWVVYTPEGHFDASPNGKKYIGWTVGMKNYGFEQFSDEFYRPGLFSLVVSGKKLEIKKDIRKGFATPPDVTILSPKPDEKLSTDTVKVVVQATDTGGGIEDIRLYHQGKLVAGTGRGIGGVRKSGTVLTKTFTITLIDGDNILRATAYSTDNIEAVPYEVKIRSAIVAKKPNLFIVAIGINKYKNPRYSLRFSKADAEGILAFYRAQQGKIFEKIYARKLFDQDATRAKILDALKLPAKPQDVVIIYMAGHGLAIDGQYYFLPYELADSDDKTVKAAGVRQDEIIAALQAVKARKVLLLLDTCQSGALVVAMRGMEEERAVKLLSKTAGVHILAASQDSQAAAELEQFGHGLFTYAILEGLKGKADFNKDKMVRISELLTYVSNEVTNLSEGFGRAQYPTMDMHGDDFPVAVY